MCVIINFTTMATQRTSSSTEMMQLGFKIREFQSQFILQVVCFLMNE